MNVLLSIRPKYAESIVTGQKKYEFRKIIFNDKYVNIAYVYVTSPVKKIVGAFKIGKIVKDCPENLWDQLNEFSGLDKAEFFDYFKNSKIGYAIEIKYVETFKEPIDPRKLIPNFTPPQSFCYLKYSLDLEFDCVRQADPKP
jgi:type I restriction enzyme S subunit